MNTNPTRQLLVCLRQSIGIGLLATTLAAGQTLHSGRITRSFTEPIEKSVAASAEMGIISMIHVKEGDRVAVGDSLAVINHKVLLETLAIAKAKSESSARLDAAKSLMELMESQLEAVRSLVDGGHTNKYEVEQKTAEYQKAVSEFRAAEDDLKFSKLEVNRIQAQINDRIIKSPIDGFVTEIHKQLGENVSNTEPQFATIVRVDELKVRFYLDAETVRNAKVGDRVTVLIGKQRVPGPATVLYVAPVIDPDTGLGRLDVKIENADLKIQSGIRCFWSGMRASLETTTQPNRNVKKR